MPEDACSDKSNDSWQTQSTPFLVVNTFIGRNLLIHNKSMRRFFLLINKITMPIFLAIIIPSFQPELKSMIS